MPLFGKKTRPPTKAPNQPARPDKSGPKPPRILGIGWLGLKAADVYAEANFLENELGLRHIEEGNSSEGHHMRYDCRPLELELVSGGTVWATRPKPRLGQPDVPLVPSFKVDNIAAIAARLNEREVPMTQIFEQGWSSSFLFLDPERQLWQVNETHIEPPVNTEQPTIIAALWLAAEDYPAQVAFYRDVLGLPLIEQPTEARPITLRAELLQQAELAGEVLEPLTEGFEILPPFEKPDLLPDEVHVLTSDKVTLGAVFFQKGVRLGLSPGGKQLAEGAERVWGRDTAFLPGLQTTNLKAMTERLKAAGVKTSGPFPHYRSQPHPDYRAPTTITTQAMRFSDPEGNLWQLYE